MNNAKPVTVQIECSPEIAEKLAPILKLVKDPQITTTPEELEELEKDLFLVPTLPRGNAYQSTKMGRSRYKITNNEQPLFITSTVLQWIPVFTRPARVEMLFDSLRFLMEDGLKVYAYVILENHLHIIVQSNRLDRDIARFKSLTAKQLIRYLDEHNVRPILEQLAFYKKAHKGDRTYQFWQDGVHPEWIQNEMMMRQKVEYIHHNPFERGYVDEAVHWRYSSTRNYAGLEGLLEVYTAW